MTAAEVNFHLTKGALGGNARRLVFTPAASRTLYAERQVTATKSESGGQLFGRFEDKCVTITAATTPSPTDQRSRFRFSRALSTEQAEIDQAFSTGDHYLGDWHTHPESIPSPSLTDKRTATRLYRTSKSDLKNFLMVIVGTMDFPSGIYVALVNGRRIRPLKVIVDN